MVLKITPNDDLEAVDGSDFGRRTWTSVGDDPAFTLRYGLIRPPYIVVEICAVGGQAIAPKVYLNKGRGFREADAIPLAAGERFVIKLNIGRIGSIRAVRIDPCSGDATFEFATTTFGSTSEADIYVSQLLRAKAGTRLDVDQVPRFGIGLPRVHIRKRSPIKEFIRSTYDLAAQVSPMPKTENSPWVSVVVPVYNAPSRYLDDLVASFERQDETGWELILSDDASTSSDTIKSLTAVASRQNIKVVRNKHNGGIAAATNSGLAHARGRWVTFVDHDDLLAPHALKVIRRALIEHPGAMFLYTDEIVVDDNLAPKGVMLKPAYDPVLLTGVNYINHLSFYRRERLLEISYLRTGYDGSQDYDLLLRYLEGLDPDVVFHLPYPAYWWRRTGSTYSRTFLESSTNNARRAITESLDRTGLLAEIAPALTQTLHRPVFDIDRWPKISIIIPSKDGLTLIRRILGDLFEKTDYTDFEVIVVDNGTTDTEVVDLYETYHQRYRNFKAEIVVEKFNFARSINRGYRLASGDHFLVLNNDVEVLDPGWLKEMVSCLQFEDAGIVGAKLLFPDEKIQHAGVIVGFGGLAGHWYLNKPANYGGPLNRLHVRNSMTCVTGAVMLISGHCWSQVGEWDEERFAVAYNDVDYCMRAHKLGFRIIWTPFACLFHHESLSRGSEIGKEKRIRFEREKQNLRDRHDTENFQDPTTNPNYTKNTSMPRLLPPTSLHPARTWRS